ncbi:MAG: DUF2851 family protein [Luteibaculaceae bacterium]
MNEDFLQLIWKIGIPQGVKLKTICGKKLSIKKKGYQNTLAGPDFLEAAVEIEDTLWAGSVEMHLKTSLWNTHGHQQDERYNNVILHVVWVHDTEIITQNGHSPPILELEQYFNENLFQTYLNLINAPKALACSGLIAEINQDKISIWLNKLIVERLHSKALDIQNRAAKYNYDYTEMAYRLLVSSMGFGNNKESFELLATHVDYKTLLKIRDNQEVVEAFFMGLAGLLDDNFRDEYPNRLKNHWEFLKAKHSLKGIYRLKMRFGGIRPANYPTIRIAQLAALISKHENLIQGLSLINQGKSFKTFFTVRPNEYWQQHYIFDKPNKAKKNKGIGEQSINLLVINFVVPFLYAYRLQNDVAYEIEDLLGILEKIDPEQNRFVNLFANEKLNVKNALETQSFLHLYKNYCQPKKCASCMIGAEIISKKWSFLNQ